MVAVPISLLPKRNSSAGPLKGPLPINLTLWSVSVAICLILSNKSGYVNDVFESESNHQRQCPTHFKYYATVFCGLNTLLEKTARFDLVPIDYEYSFALRKRLHNLYYYNDSAK